MRLIYSRWHAGCCRCTCVPYKGKTLVIVRSGYHASLPFPGRLCHSSYRHTAHTCGAHSQTFSKLNDTEGEKTHTMAATAALSLTSLIPPFCTAVLHCNRNETTPKGGGAHGSAATTAAGRSDSSTLDDFSELRATSKDDEVNTKNAMSQMESPI